MSVLGLNISDRVRQEKLTVEEFERIVTLISALSAGLNKAVVRTMLAKKAGYTSNPDNENKLLDLAGRRFDPQQIPKRPDLPFEVSIAAGEYVDENFDDTSRYFILNEVIKREFSEADFLREIVGTRVVNEIGEAFGRYSELLDTLRDLPGQCVNERGVYLIFSPVEGDRLTVGLMRITLEMNGEKPGRLPKYVTEQFNDDGSHSQFVEGFMLEASGFVYAIGKITTRRNFRISKLEVESRPKADGSGTVRDDLIGLRLGGHIDGRRPNAHRIYCYQVIGADRQAEMEMLLKTQGSLRSYDNLANLIAQDFKIRDVVAKSIENYLLDTKSSPPGNLNSLDLNSQTSSGTGEKTGT